MNDPARNSPGLGGIGLLRRLDADWLALGLAACILAGSLIPQEQASSIKLVSDRLQHLLAYGALAFLAGWNRATAKRAVVALLAVVLFGAAIEFLQPLFGRDGEIGDFAFNCAGAVAGAGLAWFVRRSAFRA